MNWKTNSSRWSSVGCVNYLMDCIKSCPTNGTKRRTLLALNRSGMMIAIMISKRLRKLHFGYWTLKIVLITHMEREFLLFHRSGIGRSIFGQRNFIVLSVNYFLHWLSKNQQTFLAEAKTSIPVKKIWICFITGSKVHHSCCYLSTLNLSRIWLLFSKNFHNSQL